MANDPLTPRAFGGEQPVGRGSPPTDARAVPQARAPADPGVTAQPADMGAQVGQAMAAGGTAVSDVARVFAEANARWRARADAGNRQRWHTQYEEATESDTQATLAKGDITNPADMLALGQTFEARKADFLAKHRAEGASEDSLSKLDVQLEVTRSGRIARAAALKQAETLKRTDQRTDKIMTGVVEDVSADPGSIDAAIAKADMALDDIADTVPATKTTADKQRARGVAVTVAVDNHITQVEADKAAALLARHDVAERLHPDTLRVLKLKAAGAVAVERKEGIKAKLDAVERTARMQVLSSELTVQLAKIQAAQSEARSAGAAEKHAVEKERLQGRVDAAGDKLQRAKDEGESKVAIARLEKEQETLRAERARVDKEQADFAAQTAKEGAEHGKRMNELKSAALKVQEEILKLSEAGNPTLKQENAGDFIQRHADEYGARALPQWMENKWRMAFTMYRREERDPVTGATVRRDLPPSVMEALRKREELNSRGAVAWEENQPTPALPAPLRGGTQGSAQPGGPPTRPQRTVWNAADDIVGIYPEAARLAAKTPFAGALVADTDIARAAQMALSDVDMATNDLVRVLQNSPRYTEGEREQIRKQVDLTRSVPGRLLGNPTEYRNELMGIRDNLQRRAKNAYETARTGAVGAEETKHAMNVYQGVMQFLVTLGVPLEFNDAGEVDAARAGGSLKVGDVFFFQGRKKQVAK